jgi:hypothetical protein
MDVTLPNTVNDKQVTLISWIISTLDHLNSTGLERKDPSKIMGAYWAGSPSYIRELGNAPGLGWQYKCACLDFIIILSAVMQA